MTTRLETKLSLWSQHCINRSNLIYPENTRLSYIFNSRLVGQELAHHFLTVFFFIIIIIFYFINRFCFISVSFYSKTTFRFVETIVTGNVWYVRMIKEYENNFSDHSTFVASTRLARL